MVHKINRRINKMEFKEGEVYKRLEGANVAFTVGQCYPVRINDDGVPYILSDNGAPWYSGEIIDDRFELVQDNKEDMNMEYEFKKGQVYEYVGDTDEVFSHGQKVVVESNGDFNYVRSKRGTKWFDCDFTGNELRLVTEPLTEKNATKHEEEGNMVNPDSTFTPKPVLINAETLLKNIAMKKLTSGEIVAYLEGYVKGARF